MLDDLLPPWEIAKYNLPKSSMIYPPQNWQIQFTLKLYVDFISYFLAAKSDIN